MLRRSVSKMNRFVFTAVLAIILPVTVLAYTSPGKPQGFVNDFAGVISAQERQSIETKLGALQKSTGAEVAVVTVPSLGDETIESYATKLFQEWGIGGEAKDTGLLILVAPTEREARIEVGYGLEGPVTDLQSGNIVRKVMIPAFKEGDYYGGIDGAVDAIGAIIAQSPEAEQYSAEPEESFLQGFDPFSLFFVFIILVNVFARVLGRSKSWWHGGVIGAGIGSVIGLIWGFAFIGVGSIVILTILGLLFDFIVSKRPPGSGGRGGGIWPISLGGRHGGGSSGGGFGGFGGGMSGGGGASGRW